MLTSCQHETIGPLPPVGALGVALAIATLLLPRQVGAWQEAHQIGDDVRVRVDPSGIADVKDQVRWHVLRGPLKFIELNHVDGAASVETDVPISTEDGRALLAHAARRDDRTIRITVDRPRALMRGDYTFNVRWRVNLAATRALVRDGAIWRLTWSSPAAVDGFDGARTVFELPTAGDPPQPIVASTGLIDEAAVANLTREPAGDVLELVRPHVARGEVPVWTLRVDPHALPGVADPRLLSAPNRAPAPEANRVREVAWAGGLGTLGLVFAWVVRRKSRAFAEACAPSGAIPRGLLPLPDSARAPLAGLALAAAVGLELGGWVTAGSACVALATLAASLRAPVVKLPVRGPGRWLALRPEDAFRMPPPSWPAECLKAVAVAGLVLALALLSTRIDAEAPWLVVVDSVAFVPFFVTGRASQLVPHGARAAAPWLVGAFQALRRVSALRVSPWAHVPVQARQPDELRLLVLPRVAMPGVLGIEVGLAWTTTPVGWAATPEVLARVVDASAAAARLCRDLPGAPAVPGRRPDERVVRLLPAAPTRAAAVALVRALSDALTDRRGQRDSKEPFDVEAWVGEDRRVKRATRAGLTAAARTGLISPTLAMPG